MSGRIADISHFTPASSTNNNSSEIRITQSDFATRLAPSLPPESQNLAFSEFSKLHVAGEGSCLNLQEVRHGADLAKSKYPNGFPSTPLAERVIQELELYPNSDVYENIQANFDPPMSAGQRRASFRAAGGDPAAIEEAIRLYALSSKGKEVLQNVLNSPENLKFYANPNSRMAPVGQNTIFFNGKSPFPALTIAHEMGHTKFGGSYKDHIESASEKPSYITKNVDVHDNAFRKFIGMELRPCYKETIRSNYGFGKIFDLNGALRQ